MKNCQKYLYVLLISSVLLLVSVFIAQRADTVPPYFHVYSPYSSEAEDISIFDAEDGNFINILKHSFSKMKFFSLMIIKSLGDMLTGKIGAETTAVRLMPKNTYFSASLWTTYGSAQAHIFAFDLK